MTPNESFYVSNHFPEIPELKEKDWKLKIEGAVENSFEISYEELLKMPSETIAATIECAGNSRVFLTPKADGVQWELGAVGNAEWTGVPLKTILEKAGVKKRGGRGRASSARTRARSKTRRNRRARFLSRVVCRSKKP